MHKGSVWKHWILPYWVDESLSRRVNPHAAYSTERDNYFRNGVAGIFDKTKEIWKYITRKTCYKHHIYRDPTECIWKCWILESSVWFALLISWFKRVLYSSQDTWIPYTITAVLQALRNKRRPFYSTPSLDNIHFLWFVRLHDVYVCVWRGW